MKFSEMPYKRIDMEEVEKEYKSIIERTKNAKSGKEQFEIHREYYKFTADVQTSMELAMIRHDIDTTVNFMRKKAISMMRSDRSSASMRMNTEKYFMILLTETIWRVRSEK